jgi:hypothetical protein
LIGGEIYAQYRCLAAMACMPLPDGTDPKDGASCFVNPLTALGMVEAVNYAPVKRPVPVSPSVVDCTRDRNREDARRELDRQEGGSLDAWARKWGRPLLDGYDRNNVGDLRSHNFPEPDRPAARKRK